MRSARAQSVLFAVSLAAACGDGLRSDTDAGAGGGGGLATCNPYTQQGCLPGEKCGAVLETAEPAPAFRTECVPNGSIPLGEACEPAEEVGEHDDCRAEDSGSVCFEGVCTRICQLEAGDCGEGICAQFEGSFDDLPPSTALGLCLPSCDPVGSPNVDDTSCPRDLGCYLAPDEGKASCNIVPEEVRDRRQDAACFGPAPGGCYLNGCASGYGPFFPDLQADSPAPKAGPYLCTAFCRPENSYRNGPGRARGTPGADCSPERIGADGETPYQCRFVQSFWDDTFATPETVGFCLPLHEAAMDAFGDCEALEWQLMLDTYEAAASEGEDPDAALRLLCLEDPSDPSSPLKPACRGAFRGACLSVAERSRLPWSP